MKPYKSWRKYDDLNSYCVFDETQRRQTNQDQTKMNPNKLIKNVIRV